MNKYKLLNEIVFYLEDFEEEHKNQDLKEFSIFLKDKIFSGEAPKSLKPAEFKYEKGMHFRDFPEVEFSTLVGTMYRFARHYIKKALDKTEIRTLDEFGFLATLLEEGNMNKSELINRHIMEISSGSEILKRLISKGMITEVEDQQDKRGKLVNISPIGIQAITQAFREMYKVSLLVKGELNSKELNDLNFYLNKLKYFHISIHQQDKNADIDQLVEKYAS